MEDNSIRRREMRQCPVLVSCSVKNSKFFLGTLEVKQYIFHNMKKCKYILLLIYLMFLSPTLFGQEVIGPKLRLYLGLRNGILTPTEYTAHISNGNWGLQLSFDQYAIRGESEIINIYSDAAGRNKIGSADIFSANFRTVISDYIKKTGAQNDQEWVTRADTIASKITVAIQTDRFMSAAKNGNIERIRKTLNAGIDVNLMDPDTGWTALMYASRYGHINLVRFLIDQKANANWKGPIDGISPLLLACQGGYTDIAEILLAKNADPTVIIERDYEECSYFSSLLFACRQSNVKMADMLIKKGANVNYLVYNGYSFNYGFCPLNEACARGNLELVRLLLKNGADVNIDEGNPLRVAMEKGGNEQVVVFLLQNGADINKRGTLGYNLLLHSVEINYIQAAELFLDKGYDVNTKDHRDVTAFMLACKNGHLDMAKMLYNRKANINLRDANGRTALGWAKQGRQPNVVVWLSSIGAVE